MLGLVGRLTNPQRVGSAIFHMGFSYEDICMHSFTSLVCLFVCLLFKHGSLEALGSASSQGILSFKPWLACGCGEGVRLSQEIHLFFSGEASGLIPAVSGQRVLLFMADSCLAPHLGSC